MPVTMTIPPELQLPAVTERSAYLIIVEALGAVQPSDEVGLAMCVSNGQLTIDIDGVAVRRTVALEDRVGAAGGTLLVKDRHQRAVLPCG